MTADPTLCGHASSVDMLMLMRMSALAVSAESERLQRKLDDGEVEHVRARQALEDDLRSAARER